MRGGWGGVAKAFQNNNGMVRVVVRVRDYRLGCGEGWTRGRRVWFRVPFRAGLNVPFTIAAQRVARVRSFSVGYMCRKARAVAKGPSAGLFVQIMRLATSFSHSVLVAFRKRPPVASKYSPIVLVSDSLMASPNSRNTCFNIILYCSTSSRAMCCRRTTNARSLSRSCTS